MVDDAHMTVPPAIELIRKNRVMYLGNDAPSARLLAVRLAECATTSGARHVETIELPRGWMAVAAEADWISPALREQRDPSLARAFSALIPLGGGQPNEVRFEAIVAAFSIGVAVKSSGQWGTVAGESPPAEVRDALGRSEFAVVLRANDQRTSIR